MASVKFKVSKNISRHQMPQIKSEHVDEFIDYIKEMGYDVTNERVPVKTLMPTQSKYNPDKIAGMLKNMNKGILSGKIITSRDNYIVDGHHRYKAILTMDEDELMSIIRVQADIDELLDIAHSFPKSFKQGINESKTMGFKEFIEWS